MRTFVEDRYGPAPEDVPRSVQIGRSAIADGTALVRVHAAGLNRGTWHALPGPQYRNASSSDLRAKTATARFRPTRPTR